MQKYKNEMEKIWRKLPEVIWDGENIVIWDDEIPNR